MAFCSECGAYIADNLNACPSCGKKVTASGMGEEPWEREKNAEHDPWEQRGGASAAKQRKTSARQDEDYSYSRKKQAWEQTQDRKTEKESTGSQWEQSSTDADWRNYSTNRREISDKIAVLSYFGLLFLVPYLLKKDSYFVKFHANQGLQLLIFEIAVEILAGVVGVGWIIAAVGGIMTLVYFFKGISQTLKGEMKPLNIPIIGKIQLLK